MAGQHDVLVVEKSQVHQGLWRFGRADEPSSTWGLIERNEIGGVEVKRPQGETNPWRHDRTTALCLVAKQPDEPRIEYDLSWQPVEGSMYRPEPVAREIAPKHRETLGERAERLRNDRR